VRIVSMAEGLADYTGTEIIKRYSVVEGKGEFKCKINIIEAETDERHSCRCGICGSKSPRYDKGAGKARLWRARDKEGVEAFIRSSLPRVECRKHGVTTAKVPWARHDSGITYDFEQQVAWLATTAMTKSEIAREMRKGIEYERVFKQFFYKECLSNSSSAIHRNKFRLIRFIAPP